MKNESIISACKALDSFGLPRAIGDLETNEFIVANKSFLRVVGLEEGEVSSVALSEIVKIHPEWLNKAHPGDFIPITVHLCGAGGTIGGHAALGRNNQVFLMISKSIKLDSEFEVGAAVGKELEQQKIRDYVHEQLAPEFMSAVFTLDSVRLQLEKENHPCAATLKHIQERFTQPLLHLREELDRGAAERHEFYLVARRLAAIVENSDDAIIGKDLDGVVTSWNRGAERIFGFSAEEMIGTSIRRIIPPERQEEEEEILDRLRRGQQIGHFETVRIAKDGRKIYVSLTVSPIKDETGRVVGASKIARDIGERKPREAKSKLESASEGGSASGNASKRDRLICWAKDECGSVDHRVRLNGPT